MSNTYDDEAAFEIKVYEELRCTRCVLERILRVMDGGLFVDYQMEKFGKDYKTKVGEKDSITGAIFKPGGGWAKAMMKGGKK